MELVELHHDHPVAVRSVRFDGVGADGLSSYPGEAAREGAAAPAAVRTGGPRFWPRLRLVPAPAGVHAARPRLLMIGS